MKRIGNSFYITRELEDSSSVLFDEIRTFNKKDDIGIDIPDRSVLKLRKLNLNVDKDSETNENNLVLSDTLAISEDKKFSNIISTDIRKSSLKEVRFEETSNFKHCSEVIHKQVNEKPDLNLNVTSENINKNLISKLNIDSTYKGLITYIESFKNFSLVLHNEENLLQLQTTLSSEKLCSGNVLTPSLNGIIAANSPTHNMWYRAKVTKIHEKTTEVLYIDYGNTEEVHSTSIKSLPENVNTISIPGLAMKATLFGSLSAKSNEILENHIKDGKVISFCVLGKKAASAKVAFLSDCKEEIAKYILKPCELVECFDSSSSTVEKASTISSVIDTKDLNIQAGGSVSPSCIDNSAMTAKNIHECTNKVKKQHLSTNLDKKETLLLENNAMVKKSQELSPTLAISANNLQKPSDLTLEPINKEEQLSTTSSSGRFYSCQLKFQKNIEIGKEYLIVFTSYSKSKGTAWFQLATGETGALLQHIMSDVQTYCKTGRLSLFKSLLDKSLLL